MLATQTTPALAKPVTAKPKAFKAGPQPSDYVGSFMSNSAASAQRSSTDRLEAVSNLSMPT